MPRVVIVVCAYNEAANLSKLLPLLKGYDLIVVNDGSTDGTYTIARSFTQGVINHESRMGKSASLRDAVEYARRREYEVVLEIGADALPAKSALELLLQPLVAQDVGGSTARQIPFVRKDLAYHIDEVIWAVLFQGKELQMRRTGNCFIGAVMYAFKPNVVQIEDVVNDDERVGFHLRMHGYKIVLVPRSVAFFDASTSIGHIMERRRRMYYGHLAQSESDAPSMSLSVSAVGLVLSLRESKARLAWCLPALALTLLAHLQAWKDFRMGREEGYRRWVTKKKATVEPSLAIDEVKGS
jgi:glycosyltransferase involved in cell wall biosynthesis